MTEEQFQSLFMQCVRGDVLIENSRAFWAYVTQSVNSYSGREYLLECIFTDNMQKFIKDEKIIVDVAYVDYEFDVPKNIDNNYFTKDGHITARITGGLRARDNEFWDTSVMITFDYIDDHNDEQIYNSYYPVEKIIDRLNK